MTHYDLEKRIRAIAQRDKSTKRRVIDCYKSILEKNEEKHYISLQIPLSRYEQKQSYTVNRLYILRHLTEIETKMYLPLNNLSVQIIP